MPRTGFYLGRKNLRQIVGALCVLSLSFVTAFHSAEARDETLRFGDSLAVYAVADHSPDVPDQPTFDKCHVCGAIASPPLRAGAPDRDPKVATPTPQLVAFQPAIIRPPPNS